MKRKPLSLAHKVKIVGRKIDLTRTNVAETFARARKELAEKERQQQRVVTPISKKTGTK